MANIQTPPAADISVNHKPTGCLYLSTGQLNITDMAAVKVALDTIPADFTDGIEDTVNHKITPGVAGYYLVLAIVTWINTVVDNSYEVLIKKTGVEGRTAVGQSRIVDRLSLTIIDIVKLSVTDYIELWALSGSVATTADLHSGIRNTFLSVQRIR